MFLFGLFEIGVLFLEIFTLCSAFKYIELNGFLIGYGLMFGTALVLRKIFRICVCYWKLWFFFRFSSHLVLLKGNVNHRKTICLIWETTLRSATVLAVILSVFSREGELQTIQIFNLKEYGVLMCCYLIFFLDFNRYLYILISVYVLLFPWERVFSLSFLRSHRWCITICAEEQLKLGVLFIMSPDMLCTYSFELCIF